MAKSTVDESEYRVTGRIKLGPDTFWTDVTDIAQDEIANEVGEFSIESFGCDLRQPEPDTTYVEWEAQGKILSNI